MNTPRTSFSLLLVLLASTALCSAETPAKAPAKIPPTVQEAIGRAEANAAKAIFAGELKDAQGWSTVAMELRAGAYLAPFGELASQFTGQIKNLPTFVQAAMAVEAAQPTTNWWSGRYRSQAVAAVISNDTDAFKLALARQAAWDALQSGYRGVQEKEKTDGTPTPAQFAAVEAWIEAGTSSPFVDAIAAHEYAVTKLTRLIPLLRGTPGVVSK